MVPPRRPARPRPPPPRRRPLRRPRARRQPRRRRRLARGAPDAIGWRWRPRRSPTRSTRRATRRPCSRWPVELELPAIKVVVIFNDDSDATGPTPRPTSTASPGTRTRWCSGPTGATSPCSTRAPRCRRSAGNLTELAAVLVHESTHCFQQQTAGSARRRPAAMPNWIAEGEATWVMAQVVPEATVYIKCWLGPLRQHPARRRTCERSYDGVGLFGHEGDLAGQDVGLAEAPADGHGPGRARRHRHRCLEHPARWRLASDFYSSLGRELLPGPARTTTWDMQGPGQVPSSGPSPTDVHHRQRRRPGHRVGGHLPGEPGQPSRATPTSWSSPWARATARSHDQGYSLSPTLDTSAAAEAVPEVGRLQVPGRHAGRLGLHHPGHRAASRSASTVATRAWPPMPRVCRWTSSARSPIRQPPDRSGASPVAVAAAGAVAASTRRRTRAIRVAISRGRSPPGHLRRRPTTTCRWPAS